MENCATASGESGDPNILFDQFVNAGTCKSILHTFQLLCDSLDIKQTDHRHFYRRLKLKLTSWKAQSLWAKLDKRANHKEYKKGEACPNTKVLIIGSGPCGLRTAIEVALLGGKAVVVEKRDRFSRNNVLHLWPFLITDLKNLGAKKFFGKFCAGSIEHISIRQLQCILLKAALIFGVEVHNNVTFKNLIEPPEDQSKEKIGWRALIFPQDHPVSEYQFDVIIGADGKRNTLKGFQRKEFRGKLAIAVTANFINRNTEAEARVEEISGVAFIYNQKFFHQLKEKTGIDLENIVYYKDATHYFVMTAKKQSLLDKGVLKHDYADTVALLSRSNVDQEALLSFAREAADFSTNHQLPHMDYAMNHYGQADVAMFDFTSLFQAENACRVISKRGQKLLMALVGDSLLEPFWPTGSGCARGFLGALDSAWMIRSWASGKMTPLQVIAERESIYRLLSQTKPENISKNYQLHTIDPNTRYPNLNSKFFRHEQVRPLYECDEDDAYRDEIMEIPLKKPRNDDFIDSYTLLRWCQRVLNTGKHSNVNIVDFTSSWKSGLALCALLNTFRPDLIDFDSLNETEVVKNNQLAFDLAEKELGISPVMTGKDMAECEVPDKLTMVSYLSQFYVAFKKEKHPKLENIALTPEEGPKPYRSPSHRLSILQKISNRFSRHKRIGRTEEESLTFGNRHTSELKEQTPVELKSFSKLPIGEISSRLNSNWRFEDLKKDKREVQSKVNVSAMAEILASKFKADFQPLPPPVKRIKSTPTLAAAQPASEFCYFCKRRVYIMERMSAEGLFFHRGCLRCDHCKTNLRLSNYSCHRTPTGEAKFYCFRHVGMKRPKRKHSLTEENDKVDAIPETVVAKNPTPVESTQPSPQTPPLQKKATTTIKVKEEAQNGLKNTPERVEFENATGGVPEDSEELQTLHNLSASMSEENLNEEDEDSESSESDEELSDLELSDFLSQWTSEDDADVEDLDDDASRVLTWEEACFLAETFQERNARENILSKLADKRRLQYEDTDSTEESSEDETETEKGSSSDDADDTMKDQTPPDTENKVLLDELADGREQSLSSLKPISKVEPLSPLRSPTSPASLMEARAKFFASPPEPVRLDAKLLFGIGKTNKDDEKKSKPVMTVTAGFAPVSDLNNVQPSETGEPPAPKFSPLFIKKDKMELQEKIINIPQSSIDNEDDGIDDSLSEESEESETETLEEGDSDGADTNKEIAELEDENDDEQLAVSQAMEHVLSNLEEKSASSDEEKPTIRTWGVAEEDEVFAKEEMTEKVIVDEEIQSADVKTMEIENDLEEELQQLEPSSEEESKSTETTNTEKAVLRSVSAMSDDTIVDSEDSTLQSVLRSLERMDEPSTPVLENEPWNNIDDKFVTKREKKKKKKGAAAAAIPEDEGSGSESSFTLSTPSHSIHSSLSSLNEALQYNKQVLVETTTNASDDELLSEFKEEIKNRLNEEDKIDTVEIAEVLPKDSDSIDEVAVEAIEAVENIEPKEQTEIIEIKKQKRLPEKPVDLKLKGPSVEMNWVQDEDNKENIKKSKEEMPFETSDNVTSVPTKITEKQPLPFIPVAPKESPRKEPVKSKNPDFVVKRSQPISIVNKKPLLVDIADRHPLFASKKPLDHKVENSLPEYPELAKSAPEMKMKIPVPIKPPRTGTSMHNDDRKRPLSDASLDKQTSFVEKLLPSDSSESRPINRARSLPRNTMTDKYRPISLTDINIEVPKKPDTLWEKKDDTRTNDKWQYQISSSAPTRGFDMTVVSKQLSDIELSKRYSNSKSLDRSYYITAGSKESSPAPKATPDCSPTDLAPELKPQRKLPEINEFKRTLPPLKPFGVTPTSRVPIKPKSPVNIPAKTSEKKEDTKTSKESFLSKFNSVVDKNNKPTTSNVSSTEEGVGRRRKIPVDASLKKSQNENYFERQVSVVENIDDIPFADESDSDALTTVSISSVEQFPGLWIKPRPVRKVSHPAFKRRILPATPKSDDKQGSDSSGKSSDTKKKEKAISLTKMIPSSKRDSYNQDIPASVLSSTPYTTSPFWKTNPTPKTPIQSATTEVTPMKLQTPASNQSVSIKAPSPTPKTFLSWTPSGSSKKGDKSKEGTQSEGSSTASTPKKEKKRSLLSMFLPGKSRNKSTTSSGSESSDKQKTPTSSKEKKLVSKPGKVSNDKKEKFTKQPEPNDVDLDLSKDMKDLTIKSIFHVKDRPNAIATADQKRLILESGYRTIIPPRADDEFSDSGESFLSTDTSVSRRSKLSDPKKIAQAARRQQKRQQQQRLRRAQEIQRRLEEIDVKQKELEERGVLVEKALRGEGIEAGRNEGELMQEWFNLVHEKNVLLRYESELMVQAKELELEDRQARLETELRNKMSSDDETNKTQEQIDDEKRILAELLEVVEERDALVSMLEEDRLREQEEDRDLEGILHTKGFELSSLSCIRPLKDPSSVTITS
ncbi:unnamed protein product [Acanthosepion pharaonis]|uniref:F-actin monooxygenase n=1 Tax=Acanthosepion pharaonis TaxID=158019 RepID=A0A812C8J7_ACAPH|nr:unnamed protein product [Sepia pharaonis]